MNQQPQPPAKEFRAGNHLCRHLDEQRKQGMARASPSTASVS